jgi:hypothetical protein
VCSQGDKSVGTHVFDPITKKLTQVDLKSPDPLEELREKAKKLLGKRR